MRRTSLVAVVLSAAAVALSLAACNSLLRSEVAGPPTSKQYDIAEFDTLRVSSAFVLDVSPSDTFSVNITAPENVLKHVRVERKGTTLWIGIEGFHVALGNPDLEARVTMPRLVGLQISGATKATVRGFKSVVDLDARVSGASSLDLDAETGNFTCHVSGASDVNASVKSTRVLIEQSGASNFALMAQADDFVYGSSGASKAVGSLQAVSTTVRLSGSSDIELSGSGGDLNLTGSGSSRATLNGFESRNAEIELSGSTHADINVGGELSVSLSGGSDLIYDGNPTLVGKTDITGGSKLEHR